MRHLTLAIALASLALFSASAFAQTEGWDWAPGTAPTNYTDGSWDFGINFSVNSPVTIEALGYYDGGSPTSLFQSHPVALYTSTGELLASTTVSDSDMLVGNFYYSSIAPLTLGVGTYAVYGVSFNDLYSFEDGSQLGDALTVDSNLTYLGDSYSEDLDAGPIFLTDPQLINDVNDGYFGPDVLIGSGTSSVPEPGTLALLSLGLVGLGMSLRRRRRQ